MIRKYFPQDIESKWQQVWEKQGIYKFKPHFAKATRGKYYNLVELPYPSGDLHLGHWFAFVPPDAHARYKRMTGYNVFFPNGFDAFGLPAENAAIQRGIHPKDWTMKNIENMTKQFGTMGTMIDWNYTAITCLPEYYKWNQWIFLKMFEKGLAYRGKALSNWCEVDKTVLANEHIEAGKCWRCGSEVIQKEVEQWFLKITDYADKLIWPEDPKEGWPKEVREGQNNWIGRSEGMLLRFTNDDLRFTIDVFTTRPETTDGATFMVVAPEHEFVASLLNSEFRIQSSELDKIKKYAEEAKKKTEMERKEDRTKSGIFTGIYVKNPVTGKDIPVWISDYVLAGYGTGAIMAVPFADERDREFAKKFNLPIEKTSFNAKPEGKKKVNYHLRDWSISRQRYWGTPVPIVYCKNCAKHARVGGQPHAARDARQDLLKASKTPRSLSESRLSSSERVQNNKEPSFGSLADGLSSFPRIAIIDGEGYAMIPVPYEDLPVELPYNVDYTPKGKPPLATDEEWIKVKCPKCGGPAQRDAETLDTFFDSAWYFYRYVSPNYEKAPFESSEVNKLMPVDVYFGGAEHTLGHTLYARFFTKFFKDLGLISFDEFASKRVQHGVILGPDGNRMSKSRGNVVNPDEIVKEYGADAVRLYLCFMMPYEATAPWSMSAISGIYRFLKRVWELSEKVPRVSKVSEVANVLSSDDLNQMHKTIKKVGEDLENFHFNTAVAALMTWLNFLSAKKEVAKEEYETLLKLLSPFAPYITEEIWQSIGKSAKGQPHAARDARSGLALRSSSELDESSNASVPAKLGIRPAKRGLAKTSSRRTTPRANNLAMQQFSNFNSIHLEEWPEFDPKYLVTDEVSIVVEVNGKVRDSVIIQSSNVKSQNYVEEEARKGGKVKKYLEGKQIKKVIYVEGKIINFVTN